MNDDFKQDEEERAALYDLFKTRGTPLSKEEAEHLTPILHSLNHPSTRYSEPSLIAEGGEKRIYRVFDHRLNRFVAMAQASKAETTLEQEQFLREGQLTANLTHPNIVPIYNMGVGNDGTPFFSMELVPGDSFKDIIQKLKHGNAAYKIQYPVEILLGIFNKVCDAVAYAHSRNVLHLDIKPDNIRVGHFGEVFLCDWGLASVEEYIDKGEAKPGQLDSDLLNDMTLTGTMKGTPGYMAPEQTRNEPKTKQTDIYALGAILYLILTRELPVDGKNANDVIENTRTGNIIHPCKRRISHPVPAGLAAVAMKALAIESTDRYTGVQDLQADINRFLTVYPTNAQHASIFTRINLLAQRHRKLTTWLMAFLIALAIVMSINLTIIQREKRTAETNLALFIEEQEKAQKMDDRLDILSRQSKYVTGYVNAISMIEIVDQLLARNPDPETVQQLLPRKAELHFLLQQFNAASNALTRIQTLNEKQQQLLELCREYAAIKPDDSTSLSDDEFARLLVQTEAVPWGRAMLLYYYKMRGGSWKKQEMDPAEHVQVIGAMLARLNEIGENNIPDLKFSKRPEGFHLDLSHTPYSSYVVKIPNVWRANVLSPLKLHSLDISHTPVSLRRELDLPNLKELRMVGVSVRPPTALPFMLKHPDLERVVLGKGDYPSTVVQAIRNRGIKVVEEAYKR